MDAFDLLTIAILCIVLGFLVWSWLETLERVIL
jgi:hypothetical protein